MDQILNLANAEWLGGILITCGAAWYFYRLPFRGKKPSYSVHNNNLIRDYKTLLPKLRVSYDGVDAEQISTAKVLFWNGGLQAVLGGDISQTNPIRIAAQGGASILGVTGMHVNNSDNGLDHHTSADGRSELITFQYLDRGQGAVFEIVHIGLSGNDIQVLGAGAGFTSVRHVVRQNTEPLGDRGASTIKQSPPSRRLTFTIGLLFLLSIEAIVGLAGVATIIAITRESPSFGSAFVFIVAACIGVITLYSFMRRRTPKGLELFDQ